MNLNGAIETTTEVRNSAVPVFFETAIDLSNFARRSSLITLKTQGLRLV